MDTKSLVVYFSATGTTAAAARQVAKAASADIYEIEPQQRYTSADLDWHDRRSRSSVEMNDPQSRPAIKDTAIDTGKYDVVYIGYPIWWDLAPRAVYTFIESRDLRGKTVVPFATSGGSSIANSAAVLKRTYPAIEWRNGRLLNRADDKTVRDWVGSVRD